MKYRPMNFALTSCAFAALWGICVAVTQVRASQAYDDAPIGEPYKLEGNRLVFTNWIYVRPGDVGWFDAEGRSVYADTTRPLDHSAAQWRAQDHMPWGIHLQTYKPAEVRPYVVPVEFPWEEGGVITIATLVWDQDRYKAWGKCAAGDCYFESTDGLKWERPKLGLVEFRGSRANNLIPSGPLGEVFVDPSSKDERFKCMFTLDQKVPYEKFQEYLKKRPDTWGRQALRQVDGQPRIVAVGGAVSADGFHWQQLPEPVSLEHSDNDCIGYYDPVTARYVAYLRRWNALKRAPGLGLPDEVRDTWFPGSRRGVSISETDDFRNFPLSKPAFEPGPELPPTDDIYLSCFTWIPRAPGIKLMFPSIWHRLNDTTTLALAVSPEGKTWHWAPEGRELAETGPDGSWNGGYMFASPPLMELGNGDFALRFSAYDVPHKYPRKFAHRVMGIATWPHGRIMAIAAPEKGEFATVALVTPGTKVYINARTKRAGSIRVAVKTGMRRQGFTMEHNWGKIMGEMIPGHGFEDSIPIIGDHPRTLVRWKNADDLGIKPGEPVVLLFKLEQAEVFALEFE